MTGLGAGGAQVCPQATKADIDHFQKAMGVCFQAAVHAGLSIAVGPRHQRHFASHRAFNA